jgi:hypothetical protein
MGVAMLGRGNPMFTSDGVKDIATTEGDAEPFTPTEQQILGLLPAGYPPSSCKRATNPFPTAIASLDCVDESNSDTPDFARFTLYTNVDYLTSDFYATADGMAVSQCPGGNASPATWNLGSNPGQVGGKIVCGSVEDRPGVAWTRNAQLLLASVNGGPSINDIYQWWQRYGNT